MDVRVNMILSTNGVRGEQGDNLLRTESGIAHALQDRIHRVRWFWDALVRGGVRVVGTSSKELKVRTTDTVGYTDSASKLDTRAR